MSCITVCMVSGLGLGLGCEVYCIVTPKGDHVMYHSLYDFRVRVRVSGLLYSYSKSGPCHVSQSV